MFTEILTTDLFTEATVETIVFSRDDVASEEIVGEVYHAIILCRFAIFAKEIPSARAKIREITQKTVK
ncbi:MAG: hypothetical protein WCH65_07395 [bacterium]